MDSEQFELVISLRDHFDKRIEALEKAQTSAREATEKLLEARRFYIEERLRSYEKNIDIARDGMEKRLEAMNEFRDALKDQASRYITREEHDSAYKKLDEDIHKLEISEATVRGKASQSSAYTGILLAAAAILISLGSLILQIANNRAATL
jgi:hypothetical protein